MAQMSKGTRAFGIYFIVYACSMFLGRVTSILYHLIETITIMAQKTGARRLYCGYSDTLSYSYLDCLVDFVGLALAIFVMFAAFRVFKLTKLALQSIRVITIVGIAYNVLAIAKDVVKIVSTPADVRYTAYFIAGGIATCLLSIGFWAFVYYFFSRQSIKAQFTN